MGQMWHIGGSTLAVIAMFAIACGGGQDDSGGDASDPDGMTPGGEGNAGEREGSDEAVLDFAIDGRNEPLGAQATLQVRQGVETVHLGIIGADTGTDLVVFDLNFASIGTTMGSHTVELGLPDRVANYANVNLDDELYYSQGGQMELTLSADGLIEGRFSVNLAHDQTVPGSPPAALAPSDDAMMLTGGFEGEWILNCQSRLPGHETLMSGGAFCENLEF